MHRQKKIAKEIYKIDELINKGQYEEALKSLNLLESRNLKNKTIKFNKVNFLIDIGFGLKNHRIVKKGIILGERILRNLTSENYKAILCYNIANGYMALFNLKYCKLKPEQLIGNKNLQNSKCCFREAIKREKNLESKTKKQLWTNYGNCLDSLGRVLEALYAYDEALKIDPVFPMALGNRAKAMQFFADISGAYRKAIYIKSYQLHKSALDREEELIRFGGISAKKSFEDRMQQIEVLFKDKSMLTRNIKHSKYDMSNMTEFEKFYIKFCSKHKLFLNFHIHEDDGEASVVDPIFISMITPTNDTESFFNLAKYINQIKEDYLVARLLLVQSQFKREDFNHISKRMTFVNTLDYSTFNIYIGLLKSAFKEAYNILDKVSRFINEYYKLGFTGDIYFTTIWEYNDKEGERRIQPEILNSKNISLYALYDVFLDFKSGYYKRIQNIRNALIHERLVIYDSELTNWDNKEEKYNIGYKTMLSQTINLMHLIKSVVIYLINFVYLEENRKRRDSDGLIGPMFVDTTQFI